MDHIREMQHQLGQQALTQYGCAAGSNQTGQSRTVVFDAQAELAAALLRISALELQLNQLVRGMQNTPSRQYGNRC